MKEARPTIHFATKNRGKFLEAVRVAERFRISLKQLKFEKQEIQSSKLSEIASYAAHQAAEATGKVLVAEDSGFFIEALDGFPGPYSSYVFRTVGLDGILKLMERVQTRGASFQAAVAYCRPGHRPICFTGIVRGRIANRQSGTRGFGYDPIFIPFNGDGRTFGQMTTEEKNLYSHRARAFTGFFTWAKRRSREKFR